VVPELYPSLRKSMLQLLVRLRDATAETNTATTNASD
jgi:hypothetical protein